MAVQLAPGQGFTKYRGGVGIGGVNSGLIDKIYKEFYLPAVHDLHNNKRVLAKIIRRNQHDISGKYAVIALNISRNEGHGYVAEKGRLPDPGRQGYDNARYRLRYSYGRILFTGPSNAESSSDRGAWLRIMDAEIRGLARDLLHENNRIMFGDGTGRLAILRSASAPNYTFDLPGGFTRNFGLGTQYLRKGMRVVLAAPGASNPTYRLEASSSKFAYYVRTIDYGTGVVTFTNEAQGDDLAGSTAVNITSAATNDMLLRLSEFNTAAPNLTDVSLLNEPFGLAAIISDVNPGTGFSSGAFDRANDVGDINATPNEWWRSVIVDNGGVPQPFVPDMLRQGQDLLDQTSDGTVHVYVTTHGIRRSYVNLLVAQKRFVNVMELDGGFKAVEFDGRPIVVDKDCTRGRIYGLDLEVLHLFQATDYQWMDADGSILSRMSDHDAYQATLYKYWNLGTNARNRLLGVFDIEDV
jgi:hypothetical protein